MESPLDQTNARKKPFSARYDYRILYWLAFLLGLVLLLAWAWQRGWPAPIRADDLHQLRANTTLPTPGENSQIKQTFRSERDGLAEVEILAARAGDENSNGRLKIQLLDPAGRIIASQRVDSNALAHNQPIHLVFSPEVFSAGQNYTLLISGSADNNVTVWGYDLDVMENGQVTVLGPASNAQDLRLVTRYQLMPAAAMNYLLRVLRQDGALILLSLALMFLPGCLVLVVVRKITPIWDPAAWLGTALALGVSLWPLLWLWLSVVGGRWREYSLWTVLILGWTLTATLYMLSRRKEGRGSAIAASAGDQPAQDQPTLAIHSPQARERLRAERIAWQHLFLLLILFVGLAARLLAVRDIVFPPWVDSSRHALITAVMADSGQWLKSYEPFLDIDKFPYHAGFHSLSAGLYLLSDTELPQLLLILGQLINGLVPLAVYAGVYIITRRKNVGLVAAFLVALPFFFPAYYATWGRMTQLMAILPLALTLAMTWKIIRGGRGWRRAWWLLAVLVAGLFLIHFRVFLLYLVYAAIVWIFSRGRHTRQILGSAILALFLVGPRVFSLLRDSESVSISHVIPGYNDFPIGYINTGWERIYIYLGLLAICFGVLGMLLRRRQAIFLLFLAAWIGLVALLLSGEKLGLPESSLLNTNSAYIVLFLPLSWMLALAFSTIWDWFERRSIILRVLFAVAMGVVFSAALLFGLRQQITILNTQTILTESADQVAITWLQQNVPDSAKIAVNSWLWLGGSWAGADGGAWIVPLANMESTTPPVDYIYSRPLAEQVVYFNETATAVENWSVPESVDWLREQGVTHIYVGAKGGFFDPALLDRNPDLEQIFALDGAFIFFVRPENG